MSTSSASQKGIIAWFVHNSVAANLLMVMIIFAGIAAISNVRVESFPSIPPNSITVSIAFESGSAQSAEEGVAIKVEEALQGVEGIKTIESSSDGQGVTVTVVKKSSYSLDALYRDVKVKVDAIGNLPKCAEKPVISAQQDLEEVISVNLYGQVSSSVLQQYAQELRSELLANPQIQKVDYVGWKQEEIRIEVDEYQLQALGLSLENIASKVGAASITDTGGELNGAQGKLLLKTEQQRYNAKEFASIPIKQLANGSEILLSDIAHIQDSHDHTENITRFNGQASVGVKVKMYGKYNITDVAAAVKQVAQEFQSSLPQGISLALSNDQSEPIKARLSLLMSNSIQGVVLVVGLLALFLNIRVALWVGLGLPVIFAGALALMGDSFFGLTLNELTTFGFIMALGIVVDDAVVIGESIYEQREKQGASIQSTIDGALKVATPTTFGVLTTMVAFMSMTLIEGDLGKIFAQFSYAAAFCLLFSLIESKWILPAHLAHVRMHSNAKPGSFSGYWSKLQTKVLFGLSYVTQKYYKPSLLKVLKYRYAFLALFISLFIGVIGLVPAGKVKAVFFPEISADSIGIELAFQEDAGFGMVQRETLVVEGLADALNKKLTQEYQLTKAPIQSVLTDTSQSGASITVGLSANNDRPFTANELAKRWQAELPPLEGIETINFSAQMITDKDISIELRSRNLSTIESAGSELVQELKQLNGVFGVKNDARAALMQADIEVNAQGKAMGLSSSDLIRQLQYAYQGFEVQRIQKGENEIKVKILYPDARRQSLADLEYANIRLADGSIVPLTSVASISTKYVSTKIKRLDYSRVNQVTADVDKSVTSPEAILVKLNNGIFKQLKQQYRDLDIVISGQQREKEEITSSFKGAFVVALLAIYALLAIPLKSYWQPLIIMCAIPFGMVGAIFGHMLHGISISLLSLFGMLALSGVVVNDSLLLISRYNIGRAAGLSVTQALVESGTGRLRAILLTSATTYFGLLPLLAETSRQAQFLIPAAASMGYGILFATVITLVLIPALVMTVEDLQGVIFQKQNSKIGQEKLIYD